MNNEQKLQAKNLYFQTDLSKTQIAALLNISRRSLHYWIKENDWDRLKKSAQHLPSIISEQCYFVIGHLTKSLLSESRIMRPVTRDEADTLHKLTLTINKLKNRTTINENLEMFAYFMEHVHSKSPEMVDQVRPLVEGYISSRTSIWMSHLLPSNYNELGFIPVEKPDETEEKLDMEDIFEWTDKDLNRIDPEQLLDIDEEAMKPVPRTAEQQAQSGEGFHYPYPTPRNRKERRTYEEYKKKYFAAMEKKRQSTNGAAAPSPEPQLQAAA